MYRLPTNLGYRVKLIFLGLVLSPALVAGDLLMKVSGVEGESTKKGFKGWIDVLSLGLDGHLGDTERGVKGSAGAVVISKEIDRSSVALKIGLVKGQVFSDVTMILRREVEGVPQEFAKLEFRDVVVTSSSEEGTLKDDQVLEQVGLSFRQVFYSYVNRSGEKTGSYVKPDEETDTDKDGMSDSFEDFYGFDKLVADGEKDTDKDGFTDLEEFKLGLNPRSAASTFRLNALTQKGDGDGGKGGVKLNWKSKPGKAYRIMVSPSLDQPFKLFREVTADELEEEIDLGALGLRGFYRIESVDE